MCIELSIKLISVDGEKSYVHKQLVYEQLLLNAEGEDPDIYLRPYIDTAIKQFGEEPDTVKITIKWEI